MYIIKTIKIEEEFFDEKSERERINCLFPKPQNVKTELLNILDLFIAGDFKSVKEHIDYSSGEPIIENLHPTIYEVCTGNYYCKSIELADKVADNSIRD